MAEPLRLAVVGCGAIARDHAAALRAVPAIAAVAAVDPSAAARALAARDWQLPTFADLDQLFAARLPLAAALLATPPDQHEALAIRLLENGLHVLCEKPLAPTTPAARNMLAAARATDRRLMLCSKFRYVADVGLARQLLGAGEIGDLVRYENAFCARVDMSTRWNSRREIAGGGVLMDNGSHAFDLARCLLGPLRRVQAAFARRVLPIEVEDTAHVTFESATGVLGSIDLSWSVAPAIEHYVRLVGTHGVLELGWQRSRWQPAGADWRAFGGGYRKAAAFQAQFEDFAACVQDGVAGRLDGDDALAAVTAVECAYRSAAERRWIELPALP
ncbi:MAG: Gfo/Idh/MocA family oxidoreductase [Planctomycetes bacterium]|nr:Gfo/Idh/MocA family oxidoreductase [Planctomycetota bacterium]